MASAPAEPPPVAAPARGGGGESFGYTGSETAQSVEQGVPAQAAAPQADTAGATPAQPFGSTPATTMIIRTGQASVEVDSLEAGIARVRQLAQRLGGYVANTLIQAGQEQAREATLQLKIPAASFDRALEGLRPIGRVESINVTAEDVGEEFVDVSARVANARRLEERLIALLASRTGNLEQVLAVERELARVREEIERHEGRLRYLRSRVSISTLTVVVHEPRALVGDYPGESPIGNAFRTAWRNFVGFVAGFIASLGVLVPLLLLLVAAWWLFRKLLGAMRGAGRRGPPPPDAAPPPPPTTPEA